MIVLSALTVADEQDAWRRAGFTVDDDGQCRIGSVRVWVEPQEGAKGVLSWTLDGAGELSTVDGLPTVSPTLDLAEPDRHANGSRLIDHLVVSTPDLGRTTAALERIGMVPRRTRDAGRDMRQVFYRMGEVILELVGPAEPNGDGPARFFGIAVTVDDLDATKELLGDSLGDPKDAVQDGRRIATLRKTAGLTTAVAFMSA